ncbi:hypothetical protein LINPERHAP2_LOCUS41831 [Linum perenne]
MLITYELSWKDLGWWETITSYPRSGDLTLNQVFLR